jgi:adenylate cyclase
VQAGRKRLASAAGNVTAEIGSGAMTVEIERAFVAPRVPETAMLGPGVRLRQGYLAVEGDTQVRVRITADAATLTVKAGDGLVRTELDLAVPLSDAEALWPHTAGRRLDKTRHRVEVGDHVAEVDVYAGELEGLCRVEVEFGSEAAARAFEPPAWFGREVTGDRRWTNASLARYGRPD